MQADRQLPVGDTTFTLTWTAPESCAAFGHTTPRSRILDSSAAILDGPDACGVYTATGLDSGSAVARETRTATLTNTAGAMTPGHTYRIAASAAGPAEDFVCESYNSSTRVVTRRGRWQYAHSASAVVQGRTLSWDVTLAGGALALGDTGTIEWAPFGYGSTAGEGNEAPVFVETWDTHRIQTLPGGLEERFRVRFPRLHDAIPSGGWVTYLEDAVDDLADRLEPRGADFRRVLGAADARRLLLVAVARLVAYSGGDELAAERAFLDAEIQRVIEQWSRARRWYDADENAVQDSDPETGESDEVDLFSPTGSARGL